MIIAANWKMNLNSDGAKELISALNKQLASWPDIQVVICPPSVYLRETRALADAVIRVGGQNCHEEIAGAYTGEISADMLVDCGASHVIIGHSERRLYAGEAGALLTGKVERAFAAGLQPIFCVGETLAQRQNGDERQVIATQLADIAVFLRAGHLPIIAYEPVWAIGTGRVASTSDIGDMHDFIKSECQRLIGPDADVGTDALPDILYGGSVKPDNAQAILSVPNVDGALVGGAALNAADFAAICDKAQTIETS